VSSSVIKRGSILLVEADAGVRLTLGKILDQHQYQVRGVGALQPALRLLASGSYDAVITELNVNGHGSGLQIAKAAKSLSPTPVVVIYTGFPNPQQLRAAMALRVDYLAFKPGEIAEITGALDTLITRRAVNLAMATA
jgi:DNA-binding NtrC family response regulator